MANRKPAGQEAQQIQFARVSILGHKAGQKKEKNENGLGKG